MDVGPAASPEAVSTSAASFLDTSDNLIEAPMDISDFSFHALSTESSSTDHMSSDSESPDSGSECATWQEKKWIVNESNLMALFHTCSECGKEIVEKEKTTTGSMIKVTWKCVQQHKGEWSSCQSLRGMPENNLLVASAILFTGATYTDIYDWARLMNVQIQKSTTFYKLQSSYLVPVIDTEYEKKKNAIIAKILLDVEAGQGIEICGDGRSDSPGYSAKYTSYSFMEDKTKVIIHFELLQVSQASSSVAMEVLGFKTGLRKLLNQGVQVDCVVTDRSVSVRKTMAEEFPDIPHEFDTWHTSKGLKKKLVAQGNKKANRELLPWIKSITNHLWFCCASCGGDAEELKRRWKSILYHIRGVHKWKEGRVRRGCFHRPLTDEEARKKKWLHKDSEVFKVLTNIVLDKNLARDLTQMAKFKHTGELEVFHSSMLKYVPKRLHFTNAVQRARTQLAVLDHNENVGRPQATTAAGAQRTNIVFSKHAKKWVVKRISVKKTYKFREELVRQAIKRRVEHSMTYEEAAASKVQTPGLPRNIAPVEKPDKDLLIEQHATRFADREV